MSGSNIDLVDENTKGYTPLIHRQIGRTLNATDLVLKPSTQEPVKIYNGKVRDRYNDGNRVVLVTTDRLSAFDRAVAYVPFKGAVLNETSKFWFEKTRHIMPNHVQKVPHPNLTIATAATPFPIEFVVRAYLTGSTDTSILTHYNKGIRRYCGVELPDGMQAHQKFAKAIITPTTKSDTHDELISPYEIVARGLMTQDEWDYCADKALQLFEFASNEAAKRGLILVDTKLEMGRDAEGNIILIDEVFTPDSSRYWRSDKYAACMAAGKTPESIDKEFIRRWLKDECDPYHDETLPEVPAELIAELSRRYILLYELITGQEFDFAAVLGAQKDISAVVKKALAPRVGIIMGSTSDLPVMSKAADILKELGVPANDIEVKVVSAHRTPDRMVEYAKTARARGLEVIIAGAGGAAHLPGMTASMTSVPVYGVPVVPATASSLNGLDALYSIVQMPDGIPVGTLGIGKAMNAGILAARTLANNDPELCLRLEAYMRKMAEKVVAQDAELGVIGYERFLQQPVAKVAPSPSQHLPTDGFMPLRKLQAAQAAPFLGNPSQEAPAANSVANITATGTNVSAALTFGPKM